MTWTVSELRVFLDQNPHWAIDLDNICHKHLQSWGQDYRKYTVPTELMAPVPLIVLLVLLGRGVRETST